MKARSASHRFKWSLLVPNEVISITLHIRKGEGKKEGKDGWGILIGVTQGI